MNEKKEQKLKFNSSIIVIHESTHGPGHDLRDFLIENNTQKILFIAHPLLFIPSSYKNTSRYELYLNRILVKSGKAFYWKLPEPLLYIKDFLYSIYWSITLIHRADVFFGIGNLNAFTGYFLKLFGITKNLIYYVIDYVPKRFSNSILNGIYHWIEKIAAEKSNWTWNLSPRMIFAREKKWHKKFNNQLVVPHGVHFDRIKRVPFENINKLEILFMGELLEKQGIQLVLETMPTLIKKFPKISLTIIGRGQYEADLKNLVKRLKIQEHVNFLGYIESHEEMENRIAKAAIAIALYDRKTDINDFTYYADPGKIKNYLGSGVPVVMTDVPYVAKEVTRARCGFIVNYNKEDLKKTLIYFFSNPQIMRQYKNNAVAFSRKYSWDSIFSDVLVDRFI